MRVNWRNQAWVLKKYGARESFRLTRMTQSNVFPRFGLSGSRQDRVCRWAEEAYQSLDVLRRRRQEELLPHELQPA